MERLAIKAASDSPGVIPLLPRVEVAKADLRRSTRNLAEDARRYAKNNRTAIVVLLVGAGIGFALIQTPYFRRLAKVMPWSSIVKGGLKLALGEEGIEHAPEDFPSEAGQ